MREKPHVAVDRNVGVARAEKQKQHPKQRAALPARLAVQRRRIPNGKRRCEKRDQMVRRIRPAENGKRQQHIRRERREARKVFSIVHRELQPRVILPEIEPPVQPCVRLQGIRVVVVRTPRPLSGEHHQDKEHRRCRRKRGERRAVLFQKSKHASDSSLFCISLN